MKNTLLVIVALLVGGCFLVRQKPIASTPTWVLRIPRQITKEEKKIVGAYETKEDEDTRITIVFLDNGIVEFYKNDEKERENNWSISKMETRKVVFVDDYLEEDFAGVYRINPDGSLTLISMMLTNEDIRAANDSERKQMLKFIQGLIDYADELHGNTTPSTKISIYKDWIRMDAPKEEQLTFKKIK